MGKSGGEQLSSDQIDLQIKRQRRTMAKMTGEKSRQARIRIKKLQNRRAKF